MQTNHVAWMSCVVLITCAAAADTSSIIAPCLMMTYVSKESTQMDTTTLEHRIPLSLILTLTTYDDMHTYTTLQYSALFYPSEREVIIFTHMVISSWLMKVF